MTLFFSHKQAWDFKTAMANYISTATNGNLKEHQKNKNNDNCKKTVSHGKFLHF